MSAKQAETSQTVDCSGYKDCIQHQEYINELGNKLEQQMLINENLKVQNNALKQNVSSIQAHIINNVERGDKVLMLKKLLLKVLTLSVEILVERYWFGVE